MIETMEFDKLEPVVQATFNVPFSWVPNLYGNSSHSLYMHIFYPAKAPEAGLPVLLWICGGGWESCEVEGRAHDLSYFAERGYIVCMAEYRISNTAIFPAQIVDVKTAIRFIRKHAVQFHADPDRIAVMGDSAGGHLVSLAGLTPDNPQFKGEQWKEASDRVQAVVDWYGVTDILGMAESYGANDQCGIEPTQCLVKFLGGYPQDRQELAQLATPLNYVTPDAPPFLILHGDHDQVVPFAQSQQLYDKLTAAGVPCDMIIVKGADHATIEFSQKKLLCRIADWLDKTL